MRLEEKMAKKPTRVNESKEQQTRQPNGLPPLNHTNELERDDYTKQFLKQLEDYEQELYEKDLTILRLHEKLSLQILNMSYHEGLQTTVLMIVTEDLEDEKMCREQKEK